MTEIKYHNGFDYTDDMGKLKIKKIEFKIPNSDLKDIKDVLKLEENKKEILTKLNNIYTKIQISYMMENKEDIINYIVLLKKYFELAEKNPIILEFEIIVYKNFLQEVDKIKEKVSNEVDSFIQKLNSLADEINFIIYSKANGYFGKFNKKDLNRINKLLKEMKDTIKEKYDDPIYKELSEPYLREIMIFEKKFKNYIGK